VDLKIRDIANVDPTVAIQVQPLHETDPGILYENIGACRIGLRTKSTRKKKSPEQ